MLKLLKELAVPLGGVGIVLVIILGVFGVIGIFTWPYTINTWLIFLDKEPSIVWWQGALLGVCPFLGQISIPAAIATWVLMLFIG